MARASTPTIISLDRFAKVLGMNPLHFNQVYVDGLSNVGSCASLIHQYAWQASQKQGREDLAQVLSQAEEIMALHLGFNIAPTWEVEEAQRFPQPSNPLLYGTSGLNVRGQKIALQADRGYIITGGIKAKTLIDANAAIVYTDTDSDGYFETATITVATTVTDVDEIAVYFPGESGSDIWEIRPIRVTIAGGVATIVVRRELLVKPELWESLASDTALDGLDNDNFLTDVDVYRKYNDPSLQAQLVWESPASCCCGNGCGFTMQTACALVRDSRLGLVSLSPGTWNAETETYDYSPYSACRNPDRVNLWYKAGYRNKKLDVSVDPLLERATIYLALAYFEDELCSCPIVEKAQRFWKEDFAFRSSSQKMSVSFATNQAVLNNPLGTSRAAFNAWSIIRRLRIGESV